MMATDKELADRLSELNAANLIHVDTRKRLAGLRAELAKVQAQIDTLVLVEKTDNSNVTRARAALKEAL